MSDSAFFYLAVEISVLVLTLMYQRTNRKKPNRNCPHAPTPAPSGTTALIILRS